MFRLKFYLGKIAMGTPHFLPRKWVKLTEQDCIDKAEKMNAKLDKKVTKPEQYKNYTKPVTIKWLGINIIGLGWKTKWSNTDYRFEYPPMISIVLCKLQFCIWIKAPHEDHYWESWLYYHFSTDKTKSKVERVQQCIKECPQIWTSYKGEVKTNINYYEHILRNKYKKYV